MQVQKSVHTTMYAGAYTVHTQCIHQNIYAHPIYNAIFYINVCMYALFLIDLISIRQFRHLI